MIHLVAGLLFFLLSPGVLLTIPARSRGFLASGQTSLLAAAVHATLFVAVIYLLSNVVEGFAEDPCTPVKCTQYKASCSQGCNIYGKTTSGTCDKNLICKTPSVTPGASYYATIDDVKKAQRAPFTGNDTTKTTSCAGILTSLNNQNNALKKANKPLINILDRMKTAGCYDYAIQNGVTV